MENLHLHALQFCRDHEHPESCERFTRALLDSMEEGVLVLNTDYRIQMTNRSYVEISGKKEAEILGRFCYEVTHHSSIPCWKIPGSSHLCPTREAIRTGEPASAVHSHYDSEKRLHYIELKSYPLKDQDGKIRQIIETHSDITEKMTLEAHLLQAEKMESLGNMAGGIAHDLNNILTPILGNAELALQNLSAGDSHYESFREIHNAASKASELVSHILAFSRRQLLEMHPVDLNRVVVNLNRFLNRVIRENIQIKEYLADDIKPVNADKTQLEQIIMNLVVNAGDAMPEGGNVIIETSRITDLQATCSTCGEMMSGSFTTFQVTDEGTGIAPEILPQIFEPFFTTKGADTGTGLGLATVLGIIHQHNGHINVYTEIGRGTTFKLYLPEIASGELPDTKKRDDTGLINLDDHRGGSRNILVVDDDESVRQVIERILTRYGYQVRSAESAEKALEIFSGLQERPALVITDVIMPGMDGQELTSRIREMEPDVPVLFMSGYSSNVIHQNFIVKHDLQHIQKPVTMRELITKVENIIGVDQQ